MRDFSVLPAMTMQVRGGKMNDAPCRIYRAGFIVKNLNNQAYIQYFTAIPAVK